MSTRQLRKMRERLEATERKEPVEEPQEDFEPLYVKNSASMYSGLVLSSSGSEADDNVDEKDSPDSPPQPVATARNRNNKKKKKRQVKKTELRDVDKCVQEVNELLGEPEDRKVEPVVLGMTRDTLLKVQHKYLDRNAEFERRFGVDDEDRIRKPHEKVHARRQIVFPDSNRFSLSVKGLRMVLLEEKNGIKYFKFEHSPEYQKHMHILLNDLGARYVYEGNEAHLPEPYFVPMNTMEGLLENITSYFRLDKAKLGLHLLEEAIYFMQKVSEPTFNFFDGKTRLEYKHVENRVFHVYLLAYIHVLTNKACHRTALEIAKLMLNLDPSDPLAVIFIIDVLALRARQFRWLIDLDENWKDERDISRLFNIRYSVALAKWHVAKALKTKESKDDADESIQLALAKFPNIALMFMKFLNKRDEVITNHIIFKKLDPCVTSNNVTALQKLYAKLVWQKWGERGIMGWMMLNAHTLIDQCSSIEGKMDEITEKILENQRLFRGYPIEFRRHVNLIRNFGEWLVDSDVPVGTFLNRPSPSFNAYPESGECVDVHRYYERWGVEYLMANVAPQSLLRSLIDSLYPGTQGT